MAKIKFLSRKTSGCCEDDILACGAPGRFTTGATQRNPPPPHLIQCEAALTTYHLIALFSTGLAMEVEYLIKFSLQKLTIV